MRSFHQTLCRGHDRERWFNQSGHRLLPSEPSYYRSCAPLTTQNFCLASEVFSLIFHIHLMDSSKLIKVNILLFSHLPLSC
jgi:hypothetical protein